VTHKITIDVVQRIALKRS